MSLVESVDSRSVVDNYGLTGALGFGVLRPEFPIDNLWGMIDDTAVL